MVYQLFVEEKNQPNQYHILEKKTTPHTRAHSSTPILTQSC
jgi:ribosomal protein L35